MNVVPIRSVPAGVRSTPAMDRQVARVEIFNTMAAAEPHWRALEHADSLATPYQRYDFLKLWQRHLILVVLLLANLAQNVASCLLLHTGFFREIARVASYLVVAMAGMTALVLLSGLDIVGFIGGYAAVYVMGAVLYVVYVLRGPIRIASMPKVAPR
jgi:predicted ABC-type sugar transport system permease subunit